MSGAAAIAIETEERGATPAAPLCKNGHPKTPENTGEFYDKRRNKWYTRCMQCRTEASLRHKQEKRQDESYLKREADFRKEWRKRKKAEDPEYFNRYARKQYKKTPRTPEQKAARKAASAEYRRSKGQLTWTEYLQKRAEEAAARPKRATPKAPWEIRDLWRRAAPGSALRRMFPTPMDLNKASFDQTTMLLTAANKNREDEWMN